MSERSKTAGKQPHEHGTIKSYVIGFILSLVFTIIPYYLVVNKTISGNGLLVAILGFAVIQMIIQITFFLHLGRGPKPKWNLVFFISTVGIVLVVVGGSIVIINNLHYNMQPSDQTKKLINDEGIYQLGGELTGACQGQYANHKVVILKGQVSPLHTYAHKCDTLTFINKDSQNREIGFGEHENHIAYAGQTEIRLRKGINETITLSETGSLPFHDHLDEIAAGQLTVTP
jgi:cytochrome o ubiquinol oxidase operon protein cyoD